MLATLTAALAIGLPSPAPIDTVPLYDGLGDHHYEITTSDPLAQRYFDQGLRLTHAFNHAEAIRSFEQALEHDPACATCWWGIAYALGPNINAPMDSVAGVEAHAAVEAARARREGATERERALVDALAERYAAVPPTDRAALDSAYARAMTDLAERFPDDDEIATLAADALMNLSPWDYWTRDGEPKPGTQRILDLLQGVLDRDPNHPYALHLYIHAVEAAHPDWAVDEADRLVGLMPNAGHVVHMPAHIYLRVGRYNDAIERNRHAAHVDEEFIADRGPTGLYTAAYYPHNYHFLAFAAFMAGRADEAIPAARAVADNVAVEIAKSVYFLENALAYPHLALVTFGRWDDALDEPLPPEEAVVSRGLAEYARGVTHAATGRPEEARAMLALVRQRAEQRAAGPESPAQAILPIAVEALEGEIALRGGDPAAAIERFRAAAELEDALLYDEPPLWYYPIRHSLGRAYLEADRPADAERVYREDLDRFPDNGWSLRGLALALEAQGRQAEAAEVRDRLATAWAEADVDPPGSRF